MPNAGDRPEGKGQGKQELEGKGLPNPKKDAKVAKDEAHLSNIKLCDFNLYGLCKHGLQGHRCLFAHWLADLQVPEEMHGQWSTSWRKGMVDIRYWPNCKPNGQSLLRFSKQFAWERQDDPAGIPNWAWGHALDRTLIEIKDIPAKVPGNFEWSELQEEWYRKSQAKQSMAVTQEAKLWHAHKMQQN